MWSRDTPSSAYKTSATDILLSVWPGRPQQRQLNLNTGHGFCVRGQLTWMQSRWNTCPQQPQAMDSPGWSGSPVGLAWYSMLGSYRLLRQMAHVSVQI